ncbi:four helix bundle protein [Lachnoclostridium sp. MSJ-17]|nr:four helix bundle protein [Lachnoclostridium sp. MSJ-17]
MRTEPRRRYETYQILRSGTSIGANINESQYGNSKADFNRFNKYS